MRYIEIDRAKRYSRTDSIAGKAFEAQRKIQKVIEEVDKIWSSLLEQEKQSGRKPGE
jgi:hypothetical protein